MTGATAEMLTAQIKHAKEMIAMLEAGQAAPLSADLLEQYRTVIATCQRMLEEIGSKSGPAS